MKIFCNFRKVWYNVRMGSKSNTLGGDADAGSSGEQEALPEVVVALQKDDPVTRPESLQAPLSVKPPPKDLGLSRGGSGAFIVPPTSGRIESLLAGLSGGDERTHFLQMPKPEPFSLY
jgi:hypothetical protein